MYTNSTDSFSELFKGLKIAYDTSSAFENSGYLFPGEIIVSVSIIV